MVRFLAVVLLLAGFSGIVAWSADEARWSALLLHAEPVVLVVVAVAAYLAAVRGRWAIAGGLALGAFVGFVVVRLPASSEQSPDVGPAWGRQVEACAAAIPAPTASVDVLQWTLPVPPDVDLVRKAVGLIHPDVLVLFNLADSDILEELRVAGGGEWHFHGPDGAHGGFGVYTRGEFSLCDQDDEWTEALDSSGGYSLAFVGLGETVTFPLVVTRFPSPAGAGDWAAEMRDAGGRLGALLQRVQSPDTLVIADAPVTSTYRHLLALFGDAGLVAVPTPPNWPSRVGSVPLLPVHAYDRAWAGGAWSTVASRRVGVSRGWRAPVWTRLEPSRRLGVNAVPPTSSPPPPPSSAKSPGPASGRG